MSRKKTFRFIYFNFILVESIKDKYAHANIVIIDLFKKTIELFEPHGYYDNKITKYINNIVFKKIIKVIKIKDFIFLPPSYISPKMGIQSKADAYCGMCVTITMMYLHLRILNPDVDQKKIIKYFLSFSKTKLKNIILKYARHVEKKLKQNKNIYFSVDRGIDKQIKYEKN